MEFWQGPQNGSFTRRKLFLLFRVWQPQARAADASFPKKAAQSKTSPAGASGESWA